MPPVRSRYDTDRHPHIARPYPFPDGRESSAQIRPSPHLRPPPPLFPPNLTAHDWNYHHSASSRSTYAPLHQDSRSAQFNGNTRHHHEHARYGVEGHRAYGDRQQTDRSHGNVQYPVQYPRPRPDWGDSGYQQPQRQPPVFCATSWSDPSAYASYGSPGQFQPALPTTTRYGFNHTWVRPQYAHTLPFASAVPELVNARAMSGAHAQPLTHSVSHDPPHRRPMNDGGVRVPSALVEHPRGIESRFNNSHSDRRPNSGFTPVGGQVSAANPPHELRPTAPPFAAGQGQHQRPQPWDDQESMSYSAAPRRSARLAAQTTNASESEGPSAKPPPKAPKGPKRKNKTLPQERRAPEPSGWYLAGANLQPQHQDQPKPLLVVLDLNGTLLHRSGRSAFESRPRVREFLHYLFNHHAVMVWSSARAANVRGVVEQLLEPYQRAEAVSIWAREQLHLSNNDFHAKVQVYKQLKWIWNHKATRSKKRSKGVWSQADTVLIDDNPEKARSEPHNLIEIEEFTARPDQKNTDVLGQVVRYLEVLKHQSDVSAYIRSTGGFRYDKAAMPFDWTDIELQMAFDQQTRLSNAVEKRGV